MGERVYLSGKMGGLVVGEIVDKRLEARRICTKLGLEYFDPAEREGLYEMPREKLIDMTVSRNTMEDFVNADEKGLEICSVILVLTGDTPSDGAWWEIAKAHYKMGIPVVMVAPRRDREEIMGFSNIKIPYIFSTIEGALVFIKYGLNKTGGRACASVRSEDSPGS